MTFNERVHAVSEFGFTTRQARFLVTVMLHGGVCRAETVCEACRHGLRAQGQRVLRQAGEPPVRRTLSLRPQPRGGLSRAASAPLSRDWRAAQPQPETRAGISRRRASDASGCGHLSPRFGLACDGYRQGRLLQQRGLIGHESVAPADGRRDAPLLPGSPADRRESEGASGVRVPGHRFDHEGSQRVHPPARGPVAYASSLDRATGDAATSCTLRVVTRNRRARPIGER